MFWPEDLWSVTISRMAHCDAGIKHALLALAAFHERFRDRDGPLSSPAVPDPRTQFGMYQSSRAIRSFRALSPGLNGATRQAVLLSCIIFITIQAIRGDFESVIHLVRRGVKLLEYARSGLSGAHGLQASGLLDMDGVEVVLLRWEHQIQDLMSNDFGDEGHDYSLQITGADADLPAPNPSHTAWADELSFTHVRELRDAQDRYLHGMTSKINHLDRRTGPEVVRDRAQLVENYCQISKAMDKALQALQDRSSATLMTPSETRGFQVLTLWRRLFRASMTSQGKPETRPPALARDSPNITWREYLFHEIVDCAESLLFSASSSTTPVPETVTHLTATSSRGSRIGSAEIDATYNSDPNNISSGTANDEVPSDSLVSGHSPQSHLSIHGERGLHLPHMPSLLTERRPLEPTFAPDISILPILFPSFLRCHSPSLRRRIIAILEASRRQEGLWDSWLLARICRRIIALEKDHVHSNSSTRTDSIHGMDDDAICTEDAHAAATFDSDVRVTNERETGQDIPAFDLRDHQYNEDEYASFFGHHPDDDDDKHDARAASSSAHPRRLHSGVDLQTYHSPRPDHKRAAGWKGKVSATRDHHVASCPSRDHGGRTTTATTEDAHRRPHGWAGPTTGRRVTGVKFGLASDAAGQKKLRVGFIFDGGEGRREEMIDWEPWI